MNNLVALCFHGTDRDICDVSDVNFRHGQYEDHFLGRGLYLFRDSYERALGWTKNQHKNKTIQNVIKVEINVSKENVLNFASTSWSNELDILECFLEVCKTHKIHFGTFIDFLIDEMGVDIKTIMMIDLKTKSHFVPVSSKAYTLFAYGDIQVCIKSDSVITSLEKI